jgi:molecular chaperone DnaK
MAESRAVGIDLGTTRCVLARADEAGRVATVRNVLGDLLIPSVVFFEDEELVFGRAAKQAAAAQPQRAAELAKRDLGQPSYSRAVGGQLLPAELIEGCLLQALTSDLVASGVPRPAIVLTYPGCFGHARRRALLDAAEIAGLDLAGTIADPMAVALSFAESQGFLSSGAEDKQACRALIFDLGGGKLDVAIVEVKPKSLRTRAIGGDATLGGRDWDVHLADYLASEFAKKFGEDPRYDMFSVRRLLESAEEAKQALSARQQARVRVERGDNSLEVTVTRQVFESLTTGLVERARKATEQVLSQASMAWRDLTHLLLVGGASRMPMIGRMLETLTGMKPASNIHADEAVARGAALYAQQRLARQQRQKSGGRLEITNLLTHTLGLEWRDPQTTRIENVVLISRGTELPRITTSKATTDDENQASVTVRLLEGESRQAAECVPIGQLMLHELPAELPRYSPIEVSYRCTAEGQLEFEAKMQQTGQSVSADFESAGLTKTQVSDWKRVVAGRVGLKAIHAELEKQQPAHDEDQGAPVAASAPPSLPRAGLPVAAPAPAQPAEQFEETDLESQFSTPARRRRSRPSQRSLVINTVGYLVFSALGLAIGYYIVMIIWPEWNIYHLPLPGLK